MRKVLHYSFLSVCFLLAIFVADIAVGYFFLPESFKQSAAINTLHSYYNHGFLPHAAATKKYGAYSYKAYTNSLGMLDKTTRTVTSDGRKKILFLGDSFVEGVGLPYTQTFPYFLEQKTDSNAIDILNGGVASSSPKLYYLRLKYLIEQQNIIPHEVFCFIDFSDYGDELVYEDFNPRLNNYTNSLRTFLRGNSIIYNLYHAIAQKIYYARFDKPELFIDSALYWRSSSDNYYKKYSNFQEIRYEWIFMKNYNDTNFQHSKSLAEKNISLLKQLCDKHNIKLHIVSYPPGPILIINNINNKFLPATYWKNFCISQKINFINLYPVFISKNDSDNNKNLKKYYIQNDTHWNEAGHRLVAEKLLHYITS